jgi:hypothetical protein
VKGASIRQYKWLGKKLVGATTYLKLGQKNLFLGFLQRVKGASIRQYK